MTNRAMIYRSGSRWRIVAAFTAAAVIHLSAIALASLHQEVPVRMLICASSTVDIETAAESAAPLQTEIPVKTPPQLLSPPVFVEPPPPISKTRSIIPIQTVRQTSMGFIANPRALTLNAPRPEYPYEARSRHITGSGIAVMSVDPATGFVEDAVMEQSLGNSILDHSAINAFRRWQFKRGTFRKVRVPIRFKMTGAEY